MKIGRKLGLLAGGLLAAELLAAGAGALVFTAQQRDLNAQTALNARDARLAADVQGSVQRQSAAWNALVLVQGDKAKVAKQAEIWRGFNVQLNSAVEALAQSDSSVLRQTATDLRVQRAALVSVESAHLAAITEGTYTANSDAPLRDQQAATNMVALRVGSQAAEVANTAITAHGDRYRTLALAVFGFSVIAALSGALVAWRIIGGLSRALRSLAAQATHAADKVLPAALKEIEAGREPGTTPMHFRGDGSAELGEVAASLTKVQNTVISQAVSHQRNEAAHAETLVNLGRRNQSLISRTLSAMAEMQKGESDPGLLAKLFKLDHLATRVRRNAESMLVLAGAEQTRTNARPVAIGNVVRASVSEIEDYTRVNIHHLDAAVVQGSLSTDLAHLLAELLENATRFTPESEPVNVVGRAGTDHYLITVVDQGLGMNGPEMQAANDRILLAGTGRADGPTLGLHIVGKIAYRRGITVELVPTAGGLGVTAQVRVPNSMLISSSPTATENPDLAAGRVGTGRRMGGTSRTQRTPVRPASSAPAPAQRSAPAPVPAPQPMASVAQVADAPAAPAGAAAGTESAAPAPGTPEAPLPTPTVEGATPIRARRIRGASTQQQGSLAAAMARPARESVPQQAPAPGQPAASEPSVEQPVRKRVRGAQLGDLTEGLGEVRGAKRDPMSIGRQMSGFQSGAARARRTAAAERSASNTTDHTNPEGDA